MRLHLYRGQGPDLRLEMSSLILSRRCTASQPHRPRPASQRSSDVSHGTRASRLSCVESEPGSGERAGERRASGERAGERRASRGAESEQPGSGERAAGKWRASSRGAESEPGEGGSAPSSGTASDWRAWVAGLSGLAGRPGQLVWPCKKFGPQFFLEPYHVSLSQAASRLPRGCLEAASRQPLEAGHGKVRVKHSIGPVTICCAVPEIFLCRRHE